MPERPEDFEEDWQEGPSKTQLKRQMTALQQLGESLTRLSDKQLAQVPIEDPRLLEAIEETRRIKSNSARRRHLQFIGKLMRQIDPLPIQAALDAMRQQRDQSTARFHELEALRDEALVAGLAGVEIILERWPEGDRQHLRQLLLQHEREKKADKPPSAARKLFQYLRELQELESPDA